MWRCWQGKKTRFSPEGVFNYWLPYVVVLHPQFERNTYLSLLSERFSHQTRVLADRVTSFTLHLLGKLSLNHWYQVELSEEGRGRAGPSFQGTHHAEGGIWQSSTWVMLSNKGAHRQRLHGWLTVCPWQLVICHCLAAFSGGNVINFTLPFSEIRPINHHKLRLCAGFHRWPIWQIFTWFFCPAQASWGYSKILCVE